MKGKFEYTSLSVPPEQILVVVQNTDLLKRPERLKTNPDRRNKHKYCMFHQDHGHTSRNCIQLRDKIESLIKEGYLKEFVSESNRKKSS